MDLRNYVADVPDFPKEGILFKDITPLLLDKDALKETIRLMVEYAKTRDVDVFAGPEARGFMFACPMALEMDRGFIPVRKPGKLPRKTVSQTYDLEYGTNEIQIHCDAIQPGDRVMIVDDLLATGGTAEAACKLVEKMGGIVAGLCFVVELDDLGGRALLKDYDVYSVLHY